MDSAEVIRLGIFLLPLLPLLFNSPSPYSEPYARYGPGVDMDIPVIEHIRECRAAIDERAHRHVRRGLNGDVLHERHRLFSFGLWGARCSVSVRMDRGLGGTAGACTPIINTSRGSTSSPLARFLALNYDGKERSGVEGQESRIQDNLEAF